MNEYRLPTVEEIETLTSYLPRLYAEDFSPVERWSGGEKGEDGSMTLPYPKYHPLVHEFFRHVASDGWLDYQYTPEDANRMIRDANVIKTASLEQIQTMLSFVSAENASQMGTGRH